MSYEQLRKGRFSQAGQVYFVAVALHRRHTEIFRDFYSARLLVRQMRQLHEQQALHSLAWVIMPDHLHWLFQLGAGQTLAQTMQQLKGRSARAINRFRKSDGRLWQTGYFDHALRSEADLPDVARYIVANPLRAGLVSSVRDYPHWDAEWL